MSIGRLFLIGLFITLVSCQSEKGNENREQIVKDYYHDLNQSNLPSASTYLSDSIIISEFDFIQVNTKKDWFRQFKWDSVFSPNYKIIDLAEADVRLVATISQECKRIRFLNDSPIIYKVALIFPKIKLVRTILLNTWYSMWKNGNQDVIR